MAPNEQIRVLGYLTWIQASHNGKWIRITIRWCGSDVTDEVTFNIFENDVFKIFGYRLSQCVKILNAVNDGEPTKEQNELYSRMFGHWIDHKVDVTIINKKAVTSSIFHKNIVLIFPTP
jgi:hypothetical protein